MTILAEIQNVMADLRCEPEHFQGRIIFMPMYSDIVLRERGNRENCIANSVKITEYARNFSQGRWSYLGPGSEKKWYGTHIHKQDGDTLRRFTETTRG